jgi:4-hydroxy-tetrahydrodipicolinate synthase
MAFEGVLPAVLTTFGKDGDLYHEGIEDLIGFLIDAGVAGIVGVGTMGEFHSLTDDERRTVTKLVVDVTGGRVPVTIGVSADDASRASEWAIYAASVGAERLMCLPPLTYQADEEELVEFYRIIASATDLPLMLYNNPATTKNDMDPHTIAHLFEIDNIVAVKECSGDARRIPFILELTDNEMEVLVGGDDWALEGLCSGAVGWVSAVVNIAPSKCVELYDLCMKGDLDAANAIYRRILPLARLDMQPKVIQFFKAALDKSGRYGGPTRPPRLTLTPEEADRVDEALEWLAME